MDILIIEDDIGARMLLKFKLRKWETKVGHINFETASTLDEAFRTLRFFTPQLITLDLTLAAGSLEDTILSIPTLSKIAPVVVISGTVTGPEQNQCLAAGASLF